eukprot:9047430-Pyramimonas_sp.AAC.2
MAKPSSRGVVSGSFVASTNRMAPLVRNRAGPIATQSFPVALIEMARAVVGARRLSFCGASNGTVTSKRQGSAHTIARRGSLTWSPLPPGEAASVARTRARDHVMDPCATSS